MHDPVLLSEVIEHLAPKDGETYIDATFGAGGYTQRILESADCNVIGIDQDPMAEGLAAKMKGNFKFVAGNFGEMGNLISESVDGIVFDLGVSSMQLDFADRGFSFMHDGPLDMRMSQDGESAADFINEATEKEIADVIYKYGEERKSRRIAKEIVGSRPLHTTRELADLVKRVIGPEKSGKHPATRTFQALRMHVNREMENLEKGLNFALALLKKGGRLVVVTFHSLEDRVVKLFFKEKSGRLNTINRHEPLTVRGDAKVLELLTTKAVKPQNAEVQSNARARSAKLRAATKLTNNSDNKGGSDE